MTGQNSVVAADWWAILCVHLEDVLIGSLEDS